ncbi:lipase family protein [Nocardia sp. NPDC019395]|uniref:lipase family protein n=1 Tax=Nocardia sp. NPDC019395 TaxID=3154686 RepID=UPI00340B753C
MFHSARAVVGVLAVVTALCAGLPVAAQAQPAWYPGLLLAAQPVGGDWGGLDDVQRIEYVTTGPGGELVPAQALVRLPDGDPPPGGRPVVAWDHGTSGLGGQCGLMGSEWLKEDTAPTLSRLNDAGYAVVAPDYIGLSPGSPGPHPYLQTSTEATATIDAVRAARAASADLSASWAVAGSSQGGHAALGTGHLAPDYAPELDFRGTAALAPATNLETIFLRARPDQPEMPGYPGHAVAMVLAGMTGTNPGVDIRDYLTPAGQRFIADLATGCSARTGAMLATADIGELFSRPLDDPQFAPVLREYMGTPVSGYQDPVLLVHGFTDTTVPLPLTLTLIGQLVEHGTLPEVQFLDAGHDDLRDRGGLDRALAFLGRVLPPR